MSPSNLFESNLNPYSIKTKKRFSFEIKEVGIFTSSSSQIIQKNGTLKNINEIYLTDPNELKKIKIQMLPENIMFPPIGSYRKIDYLLEYCSDEKKTHSNIHFVCTRQLIEAVMKSTYKNKGKQNEWKLMAIKRNNIIYLAMIHGYPSSQKKLIPNGLQFEQILLSDEKFVPYPNGDGENKMNHSKENTKCSSFMKLNFIISK